MSPDPHIEVATLAAFVEGALDPPETARVREHLAGCRTCMAAYADAIRYRAAWLADPQEFRLGREERGWARRLEVPARRSPRVLRGTTLRVGLAFFVPTVALGVALVMFRPWEPQPTLGFVLPPATAAATAATAAAGLVMPGSEATADVPRPSQRSGSASNSLALERELQAAVAAYEGGQRDEVSATRLVAALLAHGEVEAARDYAREALRAHPDAVPLRVFGSEACMRSNDLLEAERLLSEAARLAPADPLVALDHGLVLARLGRTHEARAAFERAARAQAPALAARARREAAALR